MSLHETGVLEGRENSTPDASTAPATQGYQAILNEVEQVLPHPQVHDLLAEAAIMNTDSLLHPLRVYSHSRYSTGKMLNAGLITQTECNQTMSQLRMAVLHDIGKEFVGPTPHISREIMKGTTYDAARDMRTSKEQSQMAIHAPAGSIAWNIMKRRGLIASVSDETFITMSHGMLYHHSTPTDIISGRGKKISYMDPVFTPTPGMSLLTNLVINVEDIRDAMSFPRSSRNNGNGSLPPEVVAVELMGLMPNERVEAAFNCKPAEVESIKLAVTDIVISAPPEMAVLRNKPNVNALTWNGQPFIREVDYSLPTLNELAASVWDSEGQMLGEIGERLEHEYDRVKKI